MDHLSKILSMKCRDIMSVSDLLSQYFKSKTLQLLASSDAAICEHSGLKGSHREDLIRLYLNDILPKRFEVGRGMVYGLFHRSKEADIVIWDANNYPRLQMQDHSLFFAESVKTVLEVKTNFNQETLNDVLEKCRTVRDIVPMGELNIEDEIIMMKQQIYSLRTGEHFEGILKSSPHIATGAVIFRGGQEFGSESIPQSLIKDIDDIWPDILILLEAGKVVLKQYKENENGISTFLEFIEAGNDSLLIFTASLLGLLSERIVNIEEPFYLSRYVIDKIENLSVKKLAFKPNRPVQGRTII